MIPAKVRHLSLESNARNDTSNNQVSESSEVSALRYEWDRTFVAPLPGASSQSSSLPRPPFQRNTSFDSVLPPPGDTSGSFDLFPPLQHRLSSLQANSVHETTSQLPPIPPTMWEEAVASSFPDGNNVSSAQMRQLQTSGPVLNSKEAFGLSQQTPAGLSPAPALVDSNMGFGENLGVLEDFDFEGFLGAPLPDFDFHRPLGGDDSTTRDPHLVNSQPPYKHTANSLGVPTSYSPIYPISSLQGQGSDNDGIEKSGPPGPGRFESQLNQLPRLQASSVDPQKPPWSQSRSYYEPSTQSRQRYLHSSKLRGAIIHRDPLQRLQTALHMPFDDNGSSASLGTYSDSEFPSPSEFPTHRSMSSHILPGIESFDGAPDRNPAYGQSTEWANRANFRGHRRAPNETYSDVSSAHASPYLAHQERSDIIADFQKRAQSALHTGWSIAGFDKLLEEGNILNVDLPVLKTLEKVTQQLKWLREADDFELKLFPSPLEVSKLIRRGAEVGIPENNPEMLSLQDKLSTSRHVEGVQDTPF
ncbi:hypothetical protein N0V83_000085 [Neocucurbitaria cava]|uniref:Lysine-specific demethylase-like domain-containing protein n=1 Tax=Neocucurbitaria cava TaxID=798079 RepID=A0A9W8YG28_9PLEO|nr:hypothetical protein N0V83_000085 [Neocucurbitaria cava]